MVVLDGRSASAAPERSLQQRQDALLRANEIRVYRAQLKRDVKARRRDAVDVLLEPDGLVSTMKVYDLLLAVPKFGRVKTSKVLQRHMISPSKTVGGLSARQRRALVLALPRSSGSRGTVRAC